MTLFVVFGLTIVLAGVALYATNTPEHSLVPNRVAAGIAADRVNILLIGASLQTGASAGSGVKLESVMLLSIQPSTGRMALTSLPADLWVKLGRHGQRPLRAAYSVGDSSGYPGAGTGLLIDTVSDILDEPIHGYIRLSIGDIARVVDTVGGIDIDIRRGVHETHGDRHRFRRGRHRLDGTAAMHYAYSRFVAGYAAEPLEREQRQREVVVGALNAVLRHGDVRDVSGVFGHVAATNLTAPQILWLAAAARRTEGIRVVTFRPLLDEVDVSTIAYRGEAVQPRGGDFATVRRLTDAVFDAGVIRIH